MTDPLRHDEVRGGPAIEVVVLDFDGVCTPSHREYASSTGSPAGPLRPELSGVVDELRAHGCTVVLLSNEFDRAWLSTTIGIPSFDHVFVGSDNGIAKPDRRAFQRVLLVADCAPGQCLVVDDDELNVHSARSIGCAGIVFDTSDPAASWARVTTACMPSN